MMEGVVTGDEQAIRELVRAWTNANEVGDVATMLSLVTDDVVFMVPNCDRSVANFSKQRPPRAASRLKGSTRLWSCRY
jgi:ketosteroid isomerase-like protein